MVTPSSWTVFQQRIDALLAKTTIRNQSVQKKKQSSNPLAWVAAIVLSLLSLIGIGVAMWYAIKQGKELAKAYTKLEQQEVNAAQAEYQANRELHGKRKKILILRATVLTKKAAELRRQLTFQRVTYEKQVARIQKMRSWAEINEG